MCVITEPAYVANTRIFVTPDSTRTRQFTVYANEVNSINPGTMMILPVPYPETVQYHDLTNYVDIFIDLMTVTSPMVFGGLIDDPNNKTYYRSAEEIEIKSVGSYLVSLAHNHQDLDLINKTTFGIIPQHIKDLLQKHYQNFGLQLFLN